MPISAEDKASLDRMVSQARGLGEELYVGHIHDEDREPYIDGLVCSALGVASVDQLTNERRMTWRAFAELLLNAAADDAPKDLHDTADPDYALDAAAASCLKCLDSPV